MNKRSGNGVRLTCVFRYIAAAALSVSAVHAVAVPDELIERVQNRYNGARTLSVEFIENYAYQGRGRPPEAGTLTLRKQGKMRWDYTQPAGKLFISDGKTVYLYTSGDNRVEKIPIRDTEDMRAPLAFLLGHLDLKKEFKDFATHPGEGGMWLDALAKSDRVPYEQVEMLVGSDGSIEHLKILGRDGSAMDFVFTNERLNPAVDDKFFHFAIPPGAEVIDAVDFGAEGK